MRILSTRENIRDKDKTVTNNDMERKKNNRLEEYHNEKKIKKKEKENIQKRHIKKLKSCTYEYLKENGEQIHV